MSFMYDILPYDIVDYIISDYTDIKSLRLTKILNDINVHLGERRMMSRYWVEEYERMTDQQRLALLNDFHNGFFEFYDGEFGDWVMLGGLEIDGEIAELEQILNGIPVPRNLEPPAPLND